MSQPHARPSSEPASEPARPADGRTSATSAAEPVQDLVLRRLAGSLAAVTWLRDHAAEVGDFVAAVAALVSRGGLVATCGNGGSAAEALHLAEELVGRYRSSRRPVRAVCLAADPTALTCIANDFGFEQVFARQAEALLAPGDALVVFSTSGRSPNVVHALHAARRRGASTFGLLGGDGGACAALCDRALVVPMTDSAFVQEAHQVVMHLCCEAVEGLLVPRAAPA